MNRRNFILGLGTAATLSGAASVTGASISNAVEPAANFQVVAEEQLEVQRNSALDYNTLKTDGNYSTFLQDDDTRGNGDFDATGALKDNKGPNMTISNETNGQLEMALAANNSNTSYTRNGTTGNGTNDDYLYPSKTPYDDNVDSEGTSPLEIQNPGNSVDVSVEYILGGDADRTTADESSLVARVFQFYIDGVRVSPDPTAVSAGGSQSDPVVSNDATDINANGTTDVDFRLNYSDGLADELADLASSSNDLEFTGTNTAIDLLDTVRFGVDT
jgi:hypothetical protein